MAFKMKFSGFKARGAVASQYAEMFTGALTSLLQQKEQEKLEEEIALQEKNKKALEEVNKMNKEIENFELNIDFDPSKYTFFKKD
jgi:flagellar basal body-associated protein FliL